MKVISKRLEFLLKKKEKEEGKSLFSLLYFNAYRNAKFEVISSRNLCFKAKISPHVAPSYF